MKRKNGNCKEKSPIIDGIGITSDTLSSRGGLSFFVRYLRNICITPRLEGFFWSDAEEPKRSTCNRNIQAAFVQFCRWNEPASCALWLAKRGCGICGNDREPWGKYVVIACGETILYLILMVSDMAFSRTIEGIVHLAFESEEAWGGRTFYWHRGDGQWWSREATRVLNYQNTNNIWLSLCDQ